jgi:hypothetical protein
MPYPTPAFKQPETACFPAATTPYNFSPASESMPKLSREEAEISALFQRLPRMLASLESLSEN